MMIGCEFAKFSFYSNVCMIGLVRRYDMDKNKQYMVKKLAGKISRCENCGKVLPSSERNEVDGIYLCDACYEIRTENADDFEGVGDGL